MLSSVSHSLKQNNVVLLIDDIAPEPCGYLVADASSISADQLNLMISISKGLVCIATSEKEIERLGLSLMAPSFRHEQQTGSLLDFTISVEARSGVTTGISAHDRARTLRTIASTTNPKADLVMPGHILPVRSRSGGVLIKEAPAEAAIDLLHYAGLRPFAALLHCLNADGELANLEELKDLAKNHNLCQITISEIVHQRLKEQCIVEHIAETELPTPFGKFKAHSFKNKIDGSEHFALEKIPDDCDQHELEQLKSNALVRVQAEKPIEDLLQSSWRTQTEHPGGLELSLKQLSQEPSALLVYVRHPQKNLLTQSANNLKISLRTPELPTASPAYPRNKITHIREFGIGAQILTTLGYHRVRLLTSSLLSLPGIDAFGIEIACKVPLRNAADSSE